MNKYAMVSVHHIGDAAKEVRDTYIRCKEDDSFYLWTGFENSGNGHYVKIESPTDQVIVLDELPDHTPLSYKNPNTGVPTQFDECTWYVFKKEKVFCRYLQHYGLIDIGTVILGDVESGKMSRLVFKNQKAFPVPGPCYYEVTTATGEATYLWDYSACSYMAVEPTVPVKDAGTMARDKLVSKKKTFMQRLKGYFINSILIAIAVLCALGYLAYDGWSKRTTEFRNDYHLCYVKLGNTVVEGHRRYRSKVVTAFGYNFVDRSSVTEETTIEYSTLPFRLVGYNKDGAWFHNNPPNNLKRDAVLKDTAYYTFITANDIVVVDYAGFCNVARPED